MKTSHFYPLLLFGCFLLFAGPACPEPDENDGDPEVDADSTYASIDRPFNPGTTEGGAFTGRGVCDHYSSLSLLHFLEDEAALWRFFSNRTHITQYSAGYPEPAVEFQEKVIVSGKDTMVIMHLVDDPCDYPFTRATLISYNQYIVFNEGENPVYYMPYPYGEGPFLNLAEKPEVESAYFEAAYAYHHWLLSRETATPDSRADSIRLAGQMETARQSFLAEPYPREDALRRAHQAAIIRHKISRIAKEAAPESLTMLGGDITAFFVRQLRDERSNDLSLTDLINTASTATFAHYQPVFQIGGDVTEQYWRDQIDASRDTVLYRLLNIGFYPSLRSAASVQSLQDTIEKKLRVIGAPSGAFGKIARSIDSLYTQETLQRWGDRRAVIALLESNLLTTRWSEWDQDRVLPLFSAQVEILLGYSEKRLISPAYAGLRAALESSEDAGPFESIEEKMAGDSVVIPQLSSLRKEASERQTVLDELFRDFPSLAKEPEEGPLQQQSREQTAISSRLQTLRELAGLTDFTNRTYTASLPYRIVRLKDKAKRARIDIIEKMDKKVFAIIDGMRRSGDPAVQARVHQIDSVRGGIPFPSWPTPEEFSAALAYETAFPVEEPVLNELIESYKDQFFAEFVATRTHIEDVERQLEELENNGERAAPVVSLVGQMIGFGQHSLESMEQRYRQAVSRASAQAGDSELRYALFFAQGLEPPLEPIPIGRVNQSDIFSLGGQEEKDAYLRVKALEATYLALQNLYREKLDGVINRD